MLIGAVLPDAVLAALENVRLGLRLAPAFPAVPTLFVPNEDVLAASENAVRDGAWSLKEAERFIVAISIITAKGRFTITIQLARHGSSIFTAMVKPT